MHGWGQTYQGRTGTELGTLRLDLLGFFQDVIIKNKISARYKISVGGHHQIVLMFNIGVGV